MTTDQLELAQQLCADHRPRDGKDAQLMVYNYVPRWFKENVPALYSTDKEPDPIIWRKFFLPEGRWAFYVTEYSEVAPDGNPDLFFGYLISALGPDCDELCYMPLEQIRDLRSPRLRLPIETDLWWRPVRLSTLKAKLYPEEDEDEKPGADDLNEQARRIKEQYGEPCTVIAHKGQIGRVITPGWLYWLFCGENGEITDATSDDLEAPARQMLIGGAEENPEFMRYCRCIIQGLLLDKSLGSCQGAYLNGGDFIASPGWLNWVPFIGEKPQPEPKNDPVAADVVPTFEKGDQVWWYEDPGSMVKTGSVQYTPHPDDDRVSVSCDERSAVNGGVVIGHIKHIAAADLHKGNGPTEEARAMRDLLYDDEGNLLSVNEIDPSTEAVLALEAEGKGYAYTGEPTQLSLF